MRPNGRTYQKNVIKRIGNCRRQFRWVIYPHSSVLPKGPELNSGRGRI